MNDLFILNFIRTHTNTHSHIAAISQPVSSTQIHFICGLLVFFCLFVFLTILLRLIRLRCVERVFLGGEADVALFNKLPLFDQDDSIEHPY